MQLIPVGILFFGIICIPESPRWLFGNGKREKGIKKLCWLRNLEATDIYIVEEVASIDADLERTRREIGAGFFHPFKALRHRHIQYRFALGSLLFMWQNGTGINAINYYSPTVLQSMGISDTSTSLLATGVFGVAKSVESIIWALFIVDRLGRRDMFMYGAFASSICMWIIGSYVKIADPANHPSGSLTSGGTAAIFFFFLWTVPYQFSWSGTPWVVNSEIFDLNTRHAAPAQVSLHIY